MKTKRRNCEECNNFIPPVPKEPDNFISDIEKAKCTSGMRLIFRKAITRKFDGGHFFDENKRGWFRYCNDFKERE